MYAQTKHPGEHADAANGVTRFTLPGSAFDDLTDQRPYTWKYQIVRVDLVTGSAYLHFYGDLRVMAPNAYALSGVFGQPVEVAGVAEDVTVSLA